MENGIKNLCGHSNHEIRNVLTRVLAAYIIKRIESFNREFMFEA